MFTDGACLGNPGPGGWAYILRNPSSGREVEQVGGARETTNNRMELTAVIRALEALKRRSRVRLISDSEYVLKGLTEWLPGWKRKNWKTAGGKPVKNKDLWQALEEAAARHDIRWHWVKGHAGHPENERADALARGAIPRG